MNTKCTLASLLLLLPPAVAVVATAGPICGQGALKFGDHRARKAEVDAAARAAGFPDADYPYYSPANGCGPDGWMNRAVPDCIAGARFTAACDRHDRAYMEVGFDRKRADDQMLADMLQIHAEWLAQRVEHVVQRAVQREVRRHVKAVEWVVRRVRVRKIDPLRLLFPILWVWENRSVPIEVTKEVIDLVTDSVDTVVEVSRQSLQTAAETALQQEAIRTYYASLRAMGEPFYQASQSKQRAYEAWVASYLDARR